MGVPVGIGDHDLGGVEVPPPSDLVAVSEMLHGLFLALRAAGFTEPQALFLVTKAMLGQAREGQR